MLTHSLCVQTEPRSRAASSTRSAGREMPAPGAMGCCVPPRPQPGLEKPEGCPLLINLRDPDRKDPSYCPLADLQEGTFTTQLVSVTIPAYDPVSFWKNVKLMAVASGDLEYAEQISVPLPLLSLDNQETERDDWSVPGAARLPDCTRCRWPL